MHWYGNSDGLCLKLGLILVCVQLFLGCLGLIFLEGPRLGLRPITINYKLLKRWEYLSRLWSLLVGLGGSWFSFGGQNLLML